MTSEKEGQENEREEKCAGMGCCPPKMFAEMMANWRHDGKCECGASMQEKCGASMQEMMKGGCWRPKEK